MDSASNISCIRGSRLLHGRHCFRVLLAGLAILTAAGAEGYAQNVSPVAGEVSGIVRSGNTAVPGATVTATDADNGTRIATTSNPDGSYTLPLAAGDYSVEVQMTAFATASREVVINDRVSQVRADFDLVLQSRIRQMPGGGRFAGTG